MASPPPSFHDLPEDLQLTVLSFLYPSDLHPFAATSRRSLYLCSHPKLWLALCLRRWGSRTLIPAWASGSDGPHFARLYRTLSTWHNLIGFWRQTVRGSCDSPPLIFFEWGPSFIVGSRVASSEGYGVVKMPFLWLGMEGSGRAVSFMHRRGCLGCGSFEELSKLGSKLDLADPELVSVEVSFVSESHFVLEERGGGGCGVEEELVVLESSSPPDLLMSEIYQYFANRTSPGSDKASRKQRRKERVRFGRKRWEPEHFVKIADCYPTPSRPLQGLWKGIGEDMKLGFYLVIYHRSDAISCRRVVDSLEPLTGTNDPIFWTTDTKSIELPFPGEEVDIYDGCIHIQPAISNCASMERVVTRILGIGSDYDSAIPVLFGPSSDFHNVEGRLWQYKGGTFGFGFLENGYIIDLKHVARNGQLLDAVLFCEDVSGS